MITQTDALLAHSVPSLGSQQAILRVSRIASVEALEIAGKLEGALTGRSAVLDAIARRRTEIRVAGGGAE